MSKQATSIMYFFLLFNMEQAKGFVSLLFFLKCGPSIRILGWGESGRDVDNSRDLTVLDVFDMQKSNCSQSSGGRYITEKHLHINMYFLSK